MTKALLGCAMVAAVTATAADARPDMTIAVDVNAPTYIDQSKSSAFPNLGYAGCISDEDMFAGGLKLSEEFFRRSPERTWEAFKGAGAYLVKEWWADESWERDKAMAYDVFAWRKRHGVKDPFGFTVD